MHHFAESAFWPMKSPNSGASSSSSALSVLLVEPLLEDLLPQVSSLSGFGFRVTAAETYGRARDIVNAGRPDVLVTAVRLAEYNGLHLVLRSKSISPDIAALVTSPTDDPVLRADAEVMGATFLVKPISTEDLLAAILRTLYRQDRSMPIRPPYERRVAQTRLTGLDVDVERRVGERRRDLSALVRQTGNVR